MKSLIRKHAFVWNKDSDLFLQGILMLCIFSMLQYFEEKKIFSELLLFSGVALLNWFTKTSKFYKGFNN